MANPTEKAAPPKGGKMNLLILGVVGLLAAGAGIVAPQFLIHSAPVKEAASEHESKAGKGHRPAFLSFGDVVVNLAEGRLTRFLRVKLILVVDEPQENAVKDLIEKQKAILKNWLITYLCDKSLDEVTGAAGVNRLRRDIQDNFNNLLFEDGVEKIRDILFEEFNVQ
jgi:flagellar FliL protein